MLILKQNAANSVPSPAIGKGTIFLDDNDTLSVKTSDGNVETFPTVGASNSQVVFMNGTSLSGESDFTYDFTNNVLSVTGNIAAGNVLTNNLLYANGSPWDLQEAAGSNNQIQYNINNNFSASANLAYDDSTQVFTVLGNGAFNNVNAGNLLTANFITGTLTTNAQPNITSVGTLTSLDVTGNLTAGNANLGNLATANFLTGTLTTAAQPNVTSLGTLTGLDVNGNIAAANITANTGVFTGNGSGLSALAGANVTGTVANATHASTANTVVDAAQPNITSVGTLTSLDVTGNASVGNLITGGGSGGTITGANLVSANFITGTLTTSAQPNITSVGTLTSLAVTGNASAGNISTGGTLAVTGNASAGNISTGGMLSVTGSAFINGNLIVDGNLVYVNVETIAVEDPIIELQTGPNGAVPVANSGKDVGTALNYYDTQARVAFMGWDVSNAEFGLASIATVTNEVVTFTTYGNLRIGNIIGNGQALTGMNGANVTGQVANSLVAGTVYTAAQPNITSVGTLTGLAVNGNITAANITANTGVFTGNGSGLSAIAGANVTGQVGNALVAGTVYTAAQPNITSVGTLTSLAVTGNASAGNLSTGGTLSVTGNANVGNIGAAAGVFTSVSGNGDALTALNASNISSGTLAQSRLANASVTLGSTALTLGATVTTVTGLTSVTSTTFVGALTGAATTAGTVTTAAQPNITSVGTLSSLAVTGNVSAGNIVCTGVIGGAGADLTGNILTTGANTTAGTITGNWTLSSGSRLQATYADLAEKYVADASYEPGTVLLFGGEHEVTAANESDSTRVAGVVSTDPAYIMNASCEGEHVAILALQGRVPCKVKGIVRKGDLMVSGSDGHAVANNVARAGTIIGKALENFDGELGVIQVVVGRF